MLFMFEPLLTAFFSLPNGDLEYDAFRKSQAFGSSHLKSFIGFFPLALRFMAAAASAAGSFLAAMPRVLRTWGT